MSTELVLEQESFFNKALTDTNIVWPKESQFAIQALMNNDYLAKTAAANPASLQNAIINVAAIGISLNPALSHAYLVPRSPGSENGKKKPSAVCLDISYKGLLHLAQISGSIEWGQAKLVYENDDYKNVGIDKIPDHESKTFGDKGKIIGVYCTVKTPGGDYLTEEMDLAAIEKVKGSSKAANGPWKTWWEEMARKTVVKRASKYWPKTERIGTAINVLNEQEGFTDIEGEKLVNPEPAPRITLTKAMAVPWKNAIGAQIKYGNLDKVLERWDISIENQAALINEAKVNG